MSGMYLETIWHADTEAGHEVRIRHRDIPVADADDAKNKEIDVTGAILNSDGLLICTMLTGAIVQIAAADVEIEIYHRRSRARGERFIPEISTDEGRARIRGAMTDPRYLAADADYSCENMGLADLAIIPGASGSLSSVAYGIRPLDCSRGEPQVRTGRRDPATG